MNPSKRWSRRVPGGRGSLLAAAVAFLILNPSPAPTQTTQDFLNPGTTYTVSQCVGSAAVPAVMSPGPGGTGNFIRLLAQSYQNSTNSITFDTSDRGAFTQMTADFDFRMTPGPSGQGEGFGFVLLNTGPFGWTGAQCGAAEEPDFAGSIGIGFDIDVNSAPGNLNSNCVSLHFNGLRVNQWDATGILNLASGQWIHATVVVRAGPPFNDVSLTLTPPGGAPTPLFSDIPVSGLLPYESRAYFAARSATVTADYDLANVQVQYAADPSIVGQWSPVVTLPIVPIHSHFLPTGKVLCYDRNWGGTDDIPRLEDPATLSMTPTPSPGFEIFCGGHAFLADGRMLACGGHSGTDFIGIPQSFIYNPFNNTWTQQPNMNNNRWYPSVVRLADGDLLVVGGSIDTNNVNLIPEVYHVATGQWIELPNASRATPLFPYLHLAPNGFVFMSGPDFNAVYLDTTPPGNWHDVANSLQTTRNYGTSVLYDTGKVLIAGGGTPTNTAEVIDLTVAKPVWTLVTPMTFARRQENSVLLPDGTVIITGGSSGTNFDDATFAVLAPEIWDPIAQTWQVMSAMSIPRQYHSEALLLPDGRILTQGGGHPNADAGVDNFNAQYFSPPYLFKGARPTITTSPASVFLGQQFTVSTPDAAITTRVTMLALNSVTHTTDMNQRFLQPSFSAGMGTLNVTAPQNPNLCPPGYYNLYLLNDVSGVPSAGSLIRILPNSPPVAAVPAASASVAATGPSGATLTLDGSGSSDPDNNIASYQWYDGTMLIATGVSPMVTLSIGVHQIGLTVTDLGNLSSTATETITITDTTAPLISNLAVSPTLLRSVSDQLVPLTVTGTVSDLVDPAPTLAISSVTSNEPGAGTLPQSQVTGNLTLNVRSERSTYVRVYSITVQAADAAGNTTDQTLSVRVRGKWFP